jgi:hypothetical protein
MGEVGRPRSREFVMRLLKTIAAMTMAMVWTVVPTISQAAVVVGGQTRVQVTADLAGLGLTPGILGTASIVSGSPLTVGFPITGGSLDSSLGGFILHEGSGVSLTAGSNTLSLSNFIIDTVSQRVLGDASLNGSLLANDLALFSFNLASVTPAQLTNLEAPALGLFFTAGAAGALTQVFGAPDLTGAQFGLAATGPTFATGAIPEPASWAMLIVGFGLVGVVARRRPARHVLAG